MYVTYEEVPAPLKGGIVLAYKATNKDGTCMGKKYKVGRTYTLKGKLQLCKNGLHACRIMGDVFVYYDVSSPVLLVEILGDVLEDGNKLCTNKLKVIRKLSKDEIEEGITKSIDAFLYCGNVDDNVRVRDKIKQSEAAYNYCRYIKDRKEIRDRIICSWDACRYCQDVKDRKEVRKYITKSDDAFHYCQHVKDRKEIRDRMVDSSWACSYCMFIEDRKEVRDRITQPWDIEKYLLRVKDSAEMRKRLKEAT
jgi:hypothetical protein